MFNLWESMAPMPEAVLHPAVAATNQRIYMFGGEDSMHNPVRMIQVLLHLLPLQSFVSSIHIYSFTLFISPLPCVGVSHRQEHVV